jgi:hypothetical protein
MSLPCYDFDRIEALEELSKMPGYDKTYVLTYYNSWSDYECSGWLAVFELNGRLFKCDGGYSPEAGDVDETLLYKPISVEEALKEIEIMKTNCSNMSKLQQCVGFLPTIT